MIHNISEGRMINFSIFAVGIPLRLHHYLQFPILFVEESYIYYLATANTDDSSLTFKLDNVSSFLKYSLYQLIY